MAVQRTPLTFVGDGRIATANKTHMLIQQSHLLMPRLQQFSARGVPVAYIVKDASGITNQWILDYIVLSMRQGLFCPIQKIPNVFAAGIPEQVCIILGRVLLFKMRTDLLGRNKWVESPHKSGPG
jgi:hypothetical protein